MTEDSIVAAALRKKDPKERAAFLDLICGSEESLRARVEERIAKELAAKQEPAAQQEPAPAPVTTPPPGEDHDAGATLAPWEESPSWAGATEEPGQLIGPYKLVQPIGAGGMGMVYLAEQQQPVRRQVALKIIKEGMDTAQVIARFEAERQALAMMDHPNIAKVLDAGTTESGRPYFVMELVKGIPVTKYSDTYRLTLRERLQLFLPVCQAIQHAHQKGIIHRDIKPSNVLVALYDGTPIPKVIDFGIAKATGQHVAEETAFTQMGTVMGTLEYMSPEQASATELDIDTRSDIYSLGALLYELLTGTPPLATGDARQAAYLEMLRRIREDEPPAPSQRLRQSREALTAASEQRKTDPGRLPKLLSGELDWIVMKALEKDRTRRYETANGLARDIERYLNGDPVEAGPPSARYRLKKFASKNRVLIGTVSAFAAILIVAAIFSTWQAVRARRAEHVARAEQERANAEAATSKAITDFLQNGLLLQASAQQQSGVEQPPDPDVKVRTLLDRAAATIGEKLQGQPLVEAGVRSTIGITYRDLNLRPQAEEQFQKAYDLSAKYRGPDNPETLIALEDLAISKQDSGNFAEANNLGEKIVAGMTNAAGPADTRTLHAMQMLGVGYLYAGDYAKAEPLLSKVLEHQKQTLGLDNAETIDTSDSLAKLYLNQRQFEKAEALFTPGLESCRRIFGAEHPYTLREMYGLASAYNGEGKYADAEPLLLKVLEGNTKFLGAEHPNTLGTMGQLARLYGNEGKFEQSMAMYQKAFDGYSRASGRDNQSTVATEGSLGFAQQQAGQLAKAEITMKDAASRALRVFGPKHPLTATGQTNLASLYDQEHRYAEAIPLYEQIRANAGASLGPNDRRIPGATMSIGRDYLALKDYAKAEKEFLAAQPIENKSEPDHWRRFWLDNLLGGALLGEKKYAEAEPLLVSGYEGMKAREAKMPASAKTYLPEAGERAVQLYKAWGKPEQAEEWRKKLAAGAPDQKH